MRQQDRDEAHRAREEWCAGRRLRDTSAVFYPGEAIRCPGVLRLSRGGKVSCGVDLKAVVKPASRVFVRTRRHPALPHPGTERLCTRCWTWLEMIVMGEHERLEATGGASSRPDARADDWHR